jgi:hypothetical protein
VFAAAAMLGVMVAGAYFLFVIQHTAVVYLTLVQSAVYAVAAYFLWRCRDRLGGLSERRALWSVLILAAIFRGMLLFAHPHSTDVYRYVWDGRVQAAGINPYRYVPADNALEALREGDKTIYPNINRKTYAHTIYPPMAQAIYFLATRVSETVTFMKLTLLLFDALVIWAILQLLRARGQPAPLVALYAWHPLPIWEVAGSGHIDIAAVAFVMLSLVAAERGSRIAAGVALAAGFATKYFPLALSPAIYRRWDWRMPLAFAITAALIYLPYLSAGKAVIGFLGGYADEELGQGQGLYIAALLAKAGLGRAALPLFLGLSALILGGLALRSLFRERPEKPDFKGTFLIATAFTVLFSPHYCWYFIWLVPFLCFYPWPSVFWLTLSSTALYRLGWPPSLLGASVQYLPFAVLITVELLNRSHVKEAQDEHAIA